MIDKMDKRLNDFEEMLDELIEAVEKWPGDVPYRRRLLIDAYREAMLRGLRDQFVELLEIADAAKERVTQFEEQIIERLQSVERTLQRPLLDAPRKDKVKGERHE